MADPSWIASFASNPYFSAGFGLLGIGTGLAVLRKGTLQGLTLLRRKLLIELEIPSKDTSHAWLLHWLGKYKKLQPHQVSVETKFIMHDNGASSTHFSLVPGPGRHWFHYKGVWFHVCNIFFSSFIILLTFKL